MQRVVVGWPIFSFVLLMTFHQRSQCASLHNMYEECRRSESFANSSFVCDPAHLLEKKVANKLESLLHSLQDKVECDCENGCDRDEAAPMGNKYTALMFVTNSTRLSDSDKTGLNATIRSIYKASKLGDENCDNGLVILYIKDKKNLATYRGKGRFVHLDENELVKLHQISTKTATNPVAEDENSPLVQSESNPKNVQLSFPVNWIPFIGLIIVLLLILLILCLFVCIVSRLCCQKKAPKKYYINPIETGHYKSAEPIYIPTPVSTLRGESYAYHHHPLNHYFGSPIPAVPLPVHQQEQLHSTSRSRSVTPTLSHRVRKEDGCSFSATDHYSSTPASRRQNENSRMAKDQTEPVRQSPPAKGTTHAGRPRRRSLSPEPAQPASNHHHYHTGAPSLPFLDPRRKLEVQTKEEFIE